MTRRLFLPALSMLLAFVFSPAEASDRHSAGEHLELEELIAQVQKQYNGKVIDVEFETRRGTRVIELELLDQHGQVWELYFHAETGELIKRERDD